MALAAALPPDAGAAPPIAVSIIDGGSAELARKLRAEVTFAGFVPVARTPREVSSARTNDPSPATLRVVSPGRVELSVARASDGERVVLTLSAQRAEGESFALRIVEQLRARLVDVGWALPSEPARRESTTAQSPPEPAAASEPARSTLPEHGAPARVEPRVERERSAVVDRDAGDGSAPRAGRVPVRLWIEAGVAGSMLQGDVGLQPHGTLGARADIGTAWSAGLLSMWPLSEADVRGPEGEASVAWTGFTAALEHRLPLPEPWSAGAGLGGGLLWADAQGEVANERDDLVARDVRLYAGAGFGQLGAGYEVASGLRLRLALRGGLIGPRWVLDSDGSELAHLGRFFASLGVAVDLGWPSSGAMAP